MLGKNMTKDELYSAKGNEVNGSVLTGMFFRGASTVVTFHSQTPLLPWVGCPAEAQPADTAQTPTSHEAQKGKRHDLLET